MELLPSCEWKGRNIFSCKHLKFPCGLGQKQVFSFSFFFTWTHSIHTTLWNRYYHCISMLYMETGIYFILFYFIIILFYFIIIFLNQSSVLYTSVYTCQSPKNRCFLTSLFFFLFNQANLYQNNHMLNYQKIMEI